MLSTSGEIFSGFGPSEFLPARRASNSLTVRRDRREMRRELRAACPAEPGVYGMIDHAERLIYVGVSRHLRKRLVTYFQGADAFETRLRRDDPPRKELRISRRAVQLVWEVAGHELLALLREHELIRRYKPDLNVRGRRRRRLAFIVLSSDDAPRFLIAAQLPKSCRYHWGPFAHNGRLMRSVELLNRQFKLPDCPSQTSVRFADDGALFPIVDRPLCLRGEVERCLAPCVGATSHRDYFAQLARARAFLDGVDDSPLEELDRGIGAAVAGRHFEQAARLHEVRTDLEALRDRLLPRPHEEPRSFIYPVARGRNAVWLLIHAGTVLAVHSEPRTAAGARGWLARIESLSRRANPQHAIGPIDDRDAGESRIVQAWFRQHPAELERALGYDVARGLCGQLAVADAVRQFVVAGGTGVAPHSASVSPIATMATRSQTIMKNTKNENRQPDHTAEKHSPNYRSKNTPRAEATRDCHTVKPAAAPSSAAENHDDANQKCDAKLPLTASKDQHEKATG